MIASKLPGELALGLLPPAAGIGRSHDGQIVRCHFCSVCLSVQILAADAPAGTSDRSSTLLSCPPCNPAALAAVASELSPVFNRDDVELWLGVPNAWLDASRPRDLLYQDLPAVLAAARADRFVAAG